MNWTLALPEIVLAACGLVILLVGVLRKGESFFLCSTLAIGAFVLTGALVLGEVAGSAFSGQFVTDPFSTLIDVLILGAGAFALMLSLDFNVREGLARFEYPVLMVFSVTGMMVMVSASDLISLYLGLELQSLCLYVLAAFARDSLRSSEAGLKYFVLGALASSLLLYGISLVYGFAGSTNFLHLAGAAVEGKAPVGLVVGLVFVLAGLIFKISAVPFHMWTPDVYEGSPAPVTTFLGTASKLAAMALILRVMLSPFGHLVPQWRLLIELVSIASMLLGAFAAIGQTSIKRLMAYSSIGHMGYALIGLAAGTESGVRGVLIYMILYVFMFIGSFACIIGMRRKGRAVEKIADLSGLARSDPALALALAIFMFSMAGIPPLAGFFGKLYVFLAAIQQGMWTLAVIGVLTSVVGAFYYIRIVKVVYFDPGDAAFDRRPATLSFVLATTGLFITFFFLLPAPVIDAAQAAARVLVG